MAKRAWSTIQGFETLRKLNKGQFDEWLRHDEPEFRVRERSAFMNRLFNLVTKRPEYQWQGLICMRSNSHGGGTGTVDLTGPLGNGLAFRLIAERQHEDYWRNFGENEHTLVAPSVSWLGDSSSFNFSYTEYKFDVPYDRGMAFIDGQPISIPYNVRIDDEANHAWGKNKRLNAEYRYEFNETWVSMHGSSAVMIVMKFAPLKLM